jgi:hypothetical protein
VTKVQPGGAKCSWCGQIFHPRRGGSPQRFCSVEHRSLFWSALRRWGERAIATGNLTIAEVQDGAATACTLPEHGDTALPDAPMRFLVQVEHSTVDWLIRLGFMRPDQRDDVAAIIAALTRIGQAPSISRIP